MTKEEYRQYLETEAWRRRRERAVERAGRRCQLCNSRGQLDVHHRTYERIGQVMAAGLKDFKESDFTDQGHRRLFVELRAGVATLSDESRELRDEMMADAERPAFEPMAETYDMALRAMKARKIERRMREINALLKDANEEEVKELWAEHAIITAERRALGIARPPLAFLRAS